MNVKSVYNFVPAPKESEVFKPDWAEKVSHDIPFSDSESGEIEIEIEAKTPIFIRNGHTKQDAEEKNERYLFFSHVVRNGKKEYFIPGSSLKGMFRNVLEIISKSRLSFIGNYRPAVRQIIKRKNDIADEEYELNKQKDKIHGGWLIEKEGEYFIYDTGKPYKIRYTDIDNNLKTNFEEHFKRNGKANIKNNFSGRTAKYKYEKILNINKTEHVFELHPLDETEKQKSWVSSFQPLKYVRFPKTNTNTFWGTIVLVGQATNYSEKTSRKGEYVFKGKKSDIINDEKRKVKVDKQKIEDFKFINRHNEPDELEDWKFFKNKLKEGIPVFFRYDETLNKKEIKDFGLSFMYKQPAKYSSHQLSPYNSYHKNKQLDLAELIFGTIEKDKELKGRVHFSHAFAQNNVEEIGDKKIVLSSPRPTYYPFYIKQNGKNGKTTKFNTYSTNGAILSGFKRYPIHNNSSTPSIESVSEKMITIIRPLNKGALFKGKIRFHNLRKVEIGALLSAITFHRTNNVYHNLGYAKPFGLGKVELKINRLSGLNSGLDDYIKAFELAMRSDKFQWDIKNLIAMACEPENDNALVYPELYEFQEYKNQGKFLEEYKNNFTFNYITTIEEVNEEKKRQKQNKEAERLSKIESLKKKIEDEVMPLNETVSMANQSFTQGEWEKAIDLYNKSLELIPEISSKIESFINQLNELDPSYNIDFDEEEIKRKRNICKKKLESKSFDLSDINELNNFNEGKPIIEKYFKSLEGKLITDKTQIEILKDFVQKCIIKSNKRWKKYPKQDWALVKKWVGPETAQQWFNELIKKQ
ncbi:MAG: hypothetical protein Kow0068_19860 [Marinilabiliales bacterium]